MGAVCRVHEAVSACFRDQDVVQDGRIFGFLGLRGRTEDWAGLPLMSAGPFGLLGKGTGQEDWARGLGLPTGLPWQRYVYAPLAGAAFIQFTPGRFWQVTPATHVRQILAGAACNSRLTHSAGIPQCHRVRAKYLKGDPSADGCGAVFGLEGVDESTPPAQLPVSRNIRFTPSEDAGVICRADSQVMST